MLENQQKYINYLTQLEEELTQINIDSEVKRNFNLQQRKDAIEKVELLVPIIGAFSAGKSSLINSFLGKNYLPVKLTPETALATELRYSNEEYIEAIKANNSIQKFEIDEIGKITKISHEFKFLRMFINNQKLKEIEPLLF